jgi:tetratricopeptide (TPR) repeat protein
LPSPSFSSSTGSSGPRRGIPRSQANFRLPGDVESELTAAGGRRGGRLADTLKAASTAYARERYGEVVHLLRIVIAEAPDSAAARELFGLALYREGKYVEAARELDRFTELTGSVEQHPVLADCHRALKHFTRVDDLWQELSEASPSSELISECRIVRAGSLADRDRLREAIDLLSRAVKPLKRPKDHHLRTWYVLADLLERAGELPRARELFARIATADSAFADAAERATSLSG